jgi:branched-chain amino acid transport system permease protein
MTLCLAEILLETFRQFDQFTGGMRGKSVSYPTIFGYQLTRETAFIMIVVALVLSMMFIYNLIKGHAGRAFHALRGSEAAAQAMGVNLVKYRLTAFAMATALAGLAGAMFAFYTRHVFPMTWSMDLSLWLIAAVVIGGFRSIYGTVLGCFVVWAVSDVFIKTIPVIGSIPNILFIFNGVLIIIVVMLYPHGVARIFYDLKRLVFKLVAAIKRRSKKPAIKGGAQ